MTMNCYFWKHLLVSLIVVVGIFGMLDRVLDQLLQGFALADEFNELGDAAAAAEDDELVFLEEQILDGAALLLVQELIDLLVTSVAQKNMVVKS